MARTRSGAEIANSQAEIVGSVVAKMQQFRDLARCSDKENQKNDQERRLVHNSPAAGTRAFLDSDPAVLATLRYRLFYHQGCRAVKTMEQG